MLTAPERTGERVLVSGVGPVSCLGLGLDQTADSMPQLAVLEATDRSGAPLLRQRTVPEFDLARFVGTERTYLDLQSRCALAAASLAFENAAVQFDEVRPGRCGSAYATMLGNVETQARFQGLVDAKGLRLASPVLFAHSYPNSTSSLLAIEFSLKGYSQNLFGDRLCSAQALEAAFIALSSSRADLMLAGGGDVVPAPMMPRLAGPAGMPLADAGQGVSLIVLETQDSLERREGYAFCELGSVVCCGVGAGGGQPARALRESVRRALEEAGVWEGDIGTVHVCGDLDDPVVQAAVSEGIESFSQVPRMSMRRYAGDTLAAAFPLECTLAADMLGNGFMPPAVRFARETKGVEFWIERRPEPMLGHAALVVGCTARLAAAAVLVAL